MTDDDNRILTPDDLREEAKIAAELARLSRPELENALKQVAMQLTQLQDELQHSQQREAFAQAQIRALKKKPGKQVRREQLFELIDAFDPNQITKLPIPGRVFLMGHVDDMLIVEVPKESTDAEVRGFQFMMRRNGLTSAALIVKEGTRFLRLRPCSTSEAKQIEDEMIARREQFAHDRHAEEETDAEEAVGPGEEPTTH